MLHECGANETRLLATKMWIRIILLKVSWIERVTNDRILKRIKNIKEINERQVYALVMKRILKE